MGDTAQMGSPKTKDVRRLFALSGNQCAIPGCSHSIYDASGAATGDLCHIKAANKGGARYDPKQSESERHAFENLILLCKVCHAIVDGSPELYPVETLQEIKSIHQTYASRYGAQDPEEVARSLIKNWVTVNAERNSGNIAINSPGAVQEQNITIRPRRKTVSVPLPPGSIGADVRRAGYIKHLIERYNQFASKDARPDRKFSYAVVSKRLEAKFGTSWRYVPVDRFDEVVAELHRRIERTKLARINKGKGHKSYSTFEEYLDKYGYRAT